jgi:hypothetical protein
MAQTTTVSVAPHILSELMSPSALAPLWNKYILLDKLNTSNIDGEAGLTRKIRRRNKIAAAVDDTEGVAVGHAEEMADAASISLVPTGKVQRINTTIRAIRRRLPGATREAVIAAIQGGSPEALPFIRDAAELIYDAHFQRAETDALALFSGASKTAGTTNTALGFTAFLDALFKILDDKPSHEEIIAILDEKGVKDLRTAMLSGTGAGLATVWRDGGGDASFFNHVPDAGRTGLRASCMGVPVYAGDKSLMPTANAGVDRLGAMFCMGRGETDAPGSLRGFAEFCEGHALALDFSLNTLGDAADAIGRWENIPGEHTDEHIVGIVYKVS